MPGNTGTRLPFDSVRPKDFVSHLAPRAAARGAFSAGQPKGANLPAVVVRLPDGTSERRKPVDLPAQFDLQLHSWDMIQIDRVVGDHRNHGLAGFFERGLGDR